MPNKLVSLVAVVVIAAACGGSDPAGGSSTSVPDAAASDSPRVATTALNQLNCTEPVVVGVVADLSGGSELFGSQMSRGVAIGMAFESGGDPQDGMVQTYQIDDCEFHVIIGDDQSNPEVAAIVARKLIEDGATVLIGSVGQDTTAAVTEVADEADVVLVATVDTADGLAAAGFRDNVFMVGPDADQEAMALCDHLVVQSGATRLAQIAPDYGFGQRTATARRETCTALGAEFAIDDVLVPAGTTSFDPIVAPVVDADPDAVLVAWTGGGLKGLVNAVLEAGTDMELGTIFGSHRLVPVFYGSAVGTTSPVAYHYQAATNAANQGLIDQVGAATGLLPDVFEARGMTAAMLVVAAVRAGDDVGSMVAALEGISVVGPGGVVEIRRADHTAIQDIPIVTLVLATGPDYFDYISSVRPEPECRLVGEHAQRCP